VTLFHCGEAVAVPELNSTGADQKVSEPADGHELFLSSMRDGGFGNFDIWRFTRQSAQEPWSNPTHLDAPINTPDLDSQPALSRDGRTLIFTSNRAGGSGNNDLWMSTRTPSGH
jgi:Tol biopolymer transport system component